MTVHKIAESDPEDANDASQIIDNDEELMRTLDIIKITLLSGTFIK